MPRGKPTTSTERMRLKRLRDQGVVPPVKTCKECGKRLKLGASGESKAYRLDLCWACWKKSPEGKIERRRQNLKREIWPIGYFAGPDDDHVLPHRTLRIAQSAASGGRHKPPGPVYIAWSDGRVTLHAGLTARQVPGLGPGDGEEVLEPEWFLAQIDDSLKTWF